MGFHLGTPVSARAETKPGDSLSFDLPLPDGSKETAHFEVSWKEAENLTAEDLAALKMVQAASENPIQMLESSDETQGESVWATVKSQVANSGIPAEQHVVPAEAQKGFFGWIKRKFPGFGKYIEVPSTSELTMGAVTCVVRGTMSSMVWMNSTHLSSEAIAGMIVFQTALSAFHTVFGATVDKFMTAKIGKVDEKTSRGWQFVRRLVYNSFWTECMKFAASGANGRAPAWTLEGQLSVLGYILTTGAGDAMLGSTRASAYSDRVTAQRVAFLGFLVMAPIQLMDFSGVSKDIIFNFGSYEITGTTTAMLMAYHALISSIHNAPESIAYVVALPELWWRSGRKQVGKITTKLKGFCDLLFKTASVFQPYAIAHDVARV